MDTIDHKQTIVLIIGVSEYPEDDSIPAIPNILANIELLKASLVDKDIVGIPEENITVSVNESKSRIEKKLKSIAEKSSHKLNTLLIYYSGHGIYSPVDFQLYFTTHQTTRKDLEIDGINIDVFKSHIRRSRAGRKVVILDCCHSGAFIGAMGGDTASQIQSNVNGFEGTYVMTSAAEDEPSLYPVKSPDKPTYFTGRLIEIVNGGLDNDCQFCSLRDLYNQIEIDFRNEGLPCPQQSNFNKADQILFWKNKLYHEKKPEDEVAWEDALTRHSKWVYHDFRRSFPSSKYEKLAKEKIKEIEEEEHWQNTLRLSTIFSITDYLDLYPEGKFAEEANNKLVELRQQHDSQQERRLWRKACEMDDLASYQEYLDGYPTGRYSETCKKEIEKLLEINKQKNEKALRIQQALEEEKKKALEGAEKRNRKQQIEAGIKKAEEEAALKRQAEIESKAAAALKDKEEADAKEAALKEKEADAKAAAKRAAEVKAKAEAEEREAAAKEAAARLEEEEMLKRGQLIIAETPYSNPHLGVNGKRIAIFAGIGAGVILLIKVIISIISSFNY